MLPGMELMGCQIEVPASVMHHVVKVESSYNPYAIGVVGGHLARQPKSLSEAVATAEMLESRGFNFSLGLAQVNRYNLKKYGLPNYSAAFQTCANLRAGSQILRECHGRAGGNWGKAFSCYYSGNFTTGFRQGYVQKVQRSMLAQRGPEVPSLAIPVVDRRKAGVRSSQVSTSSSSPARVTSRLPTAADTPSLLQRRLGLDASAALGADLAAATPPSLQATVVALPSDTQSEIPAVAMPTPNSAQKPPPSRNPAGDAAFVF